MLGDMVPGPIVLLRQALDVANAYESLASLSATNVLDVSTLPDLGLSTRSSRSDETTR